MRFKGAAEDHGQSGRPVTTRYPVQSPLSPELHVEVSLSKTLNPQMLPGRFTAAHCSLLTKDGSNAENNFPKGCFIKNIFFLNVVSICIVKEKCNNNIINNDLISIITETGKYHSPTSLRSDEPRKYITLNISISSTFRKWEMICNFSFHWPNIYFDTCHASEFHVLHLKDSQTV